ncbi:MAG: hypothetical protein RDU89_11580 [bacterium]|nr:hypothetical protein [bacterium]
MRKKKYVYVLIFRRYRRGKDGTIYDAHKYGHSAWPIRIRKTR